MSLSDPRRVAVLRELTILDTPPEPAFDDIAALASASCGGANAAVNFLDADRQWTKAMVGVDGQGDSAAHEASFCAAVVDAPGGRVAVPDTQDDPRWRGHPEVTGGLGVGHYAGSAIVVDGETVGAVCIFGEGTRAIAPAEQASLDALARQAAAQLELRSRNAELRELATRDALTGLANRTLLHEQLGQAVARREREGGEIGLLFCDVDDFKEINDRWGHEAGDQALVRLAARLRAAARGGDTVARYAGDEFVVVCPGLASARELDALVARVDHAVHAATPGSPVPLRLSIGAALVGEGESAAAALRRADEAMYAAKRGG